MQIIKDLNGAVEEYIKSLNLNDYSDKANIEQYAREDFKAGVEFAESKFNEMFLEIVTENQGLKLYKDNEAERFKKLAIEFGEWILQNDNPGFKLVFGDGFPNKWGSVRQGGGYNTTEELLFCFH
jgi:hypothetical protein